MRKRKDHLPSNNSNTILKDEKPHLQVLEKYKPIYDKYLETGTIVGLHPHIRDEIFNAYKTEYPYYKYNKSCYECIVEMITTVYKWYEKSCRGIS